MVQRYMLACITILLSYIRVYMFCCNNSVYGCFAFIHNFEVVKLGPLAVDSCMYDQL